MDDFGTGYSSLNYLKRFPIDRIKLDQSFVRDLPGDKDDAAIAMAVIAMGQSLELVVIAEGVETEEQLAFLKDRDCDQLQGFLFSRPLPPEAFETFLREEPVDGREGAAGASEALLAAPGVGPTSVRMPAMEASASTNGPRAPAARSSAPRPRGAGRELRVLLGFYAQRRDGEILESEKDLTRKSGDRWPRFQANPVRSRRPLPGPGALLPQLREAPGRSDDLRPQDAPADVPVQVRPARVGRDLLRLGRHALDHPGDRRTTQRSAGTTSARSSATSGSSTRCSGPSTSTGSSGCPPGNGCGACTPFFPRVPGVLMNRRRPSSAS